MTETYVDEALQAGDENFERIEFKTEKRFQCRKRINDDMTFMEQKIETMPAAAL